MTILSILISSSSKLQMQNFNMFTNCMQGLKTIHWKLYEDGWVYTLSCKSCLKWLCLKGRYSSVKLNFISTKAPYAYFHYVHKIYAFLKKEPL